MTAPDESPDRSPRAMRLRAVARTVVLSSAGMIAWAFSTTAGTASARACLFLVAAAAVVGAFSRRLGPALVTIGIMATALHRGRFELLDPWSLVFVISTGTGLAIWLKRSALRWVAVSAPIWTVANTHPVFMTAAVALTIGGLVVVAVGPTLPGRRKRRDVPVLPHMAHGALDLPTTAIYYGGEKSRVITWLAWTIAAVGIVLVVAAGRSVETALWGGLGLGCLIIAVTFAASNWFATRVRLRIDERGLHSRTLFAEHTIPWTDLAGLTLRYVFFPGSGMRVVYYVAFSPTREFAFTSRMKGSKVLQSAIERASGLTWPTPEIEGNF